MLIKTDEAFTPKIKNEDNTDGPSRKLKDSYLDLLEFESQLLRF